MSATHDELWLHGEKFNGGGGGSENAVQYVPQSLTDEQKAQARENIDATKVEKKTYEEFMNLTEEEKNSQPYIVTGWPSEAGELKTISVNGVGISPDVDGNVNIVIPTVKKIIQKINYEDYQLLSQEQKNNNVYVIKDYPES